MHDGDDDPDENRHKDDRFAPGAEPYDDEGTQGDFGKGVDDDDVRLEDFAHRVAPPKEQCDGESERDGDGKSCQRFPKSHADVVKECSVAVERGDR